MLTMIKGGLDHPQSECELVIATELGGTPVTEQRGRHDKGFVRHSPTVLVVFDAVTRKLRNVDYYTAGRRQTLPASAYQDGYLLEMPDFASGLVIHSRCQPAREQGNLPIVPGKRVLCVPATGLIGNIWYDGYLTHLSPQGRVLSLVTHPGRARLSVPANLTLATGMRPAEIVKPERGNYMKLCLRESIACFCGQQGFTSALTIELDDTSLAAAICLLLISSLPKIVVRVAPAKCPPAWKRLLENLGVETSEGNSDKHLPISKLVWFVPPDEMAGIVADINKRGAIIPQMLGAKLS